MPFRSQTWALLSLMFFLAAALLWRIGNERAARLAFPTVGATAATNAPQGQAVSPPPQNPPAPAAPQAAVATNKSYRLANTQKSFRLLAETPTAILLRNAWVDTAEPNAQLPIPPSFAVSSEPGTYLVQAKTDAAEPTFRAALELAGARVISYIPNNALLVELSAENAALLRQSKPVQSVLPNEPYYKVAPDLLAIALENRSLPGNSAIKVTFLESRLESAKAALTQQGFELLGADRDPFGPQLILRARSEDVAALARWPSVLSMELLRRRELANDLTRERLGVAFDTISPTNYLGLTGTNVVVNINDTGVDSTHPDLAGRVFAGTNFPSILTDLDGHGTHVAGTIASSGAHSPTNVASGSLSNANFRGMAPAAKIFVLPVDLATGPYLSDAYLQETTASNRVFISNNSWIYFTSDYNSSSASYDAAVRDALPRVTGSHPILYVFGAGNEGFGTEDGQGGEAGSVLAPANAKNVIAVGAIESLRSITNEVVANGQTNQAFLVQTDSRDQVASFSSRGNVGISIEGDFGRFKPDVVAPGSFIISTRASRWRDPVAFTNFQANRFPFQIVNPAALNNYSIFVPDNAAELTIRVLPNPRSPSSFPPLTIYLRKGAFPTKTAFDFISRNNQLTIRPPDLTPGDWFYSVGNDTSQPVNHDIQTSLTLVSDSGDYFTQLKNLNDPLGPYYRYESGTSMATPAVSGVLALMQEFFEQRLARTNSPALMKALLINGARSLGNPYDLRSDTFLNQQGWGVVNLSNSIPHWLPARVGRGSGTGVNPTGLGVTFASASSDPLQFVDQSPTRALATDQIQTWPLTLTEEAQQIPLRVTLVWTDPPGNPNAAIKLVNDLDLVVSNTVTHESFFGNHIAASSEFTSPTDAAEAPFHDVVNNVENVFLNPPLGTNYVIEIRARRVNVNAVTAYPPTSIVQDYALVVASADLTITNAFHIEQLPVSPKFPKTITTITNGVPILNQHVGANAALQDNPQQWNFYVFTNSPGVTSTTGLTNGTNVAFVTFFPPNLSRPRNLEADIDLYVSTNPALLNLNPAALATATKSVNRGGTEVVAFTNASLGSVYYVAVKSEDQQAAEYGFAGFSSNTPFDEQDSSGNRTIHGFPLNVQIPDGSSEKPGSALVFGIGTRSLDIQKVTVTNVVTHESFGDLLGNLSHNNKSVVLNNHRLVDRLPGEPTFRTLAWIYDDNNSLQPGRRTDGYIVSPTDGPGSLNDFVGDNGSGLWLFTMIDNSLTGTGQVNRLDIYVEPNPPVLIGRLGQVLPGQCTYYFVDIPQNATNMTVTLSAISAQLNLYVRRGDFPSPNVNDKGALIDPPGGSLNLGITDVPPLTPGRYFIGVCNPNNVAANFRITVLVGHGIVGDLTREFSSIDTPLTILDDAITTSTIRVESDRDISAARVGVRIDHPRVSDLALHLVSPSGTRVLLVENRGGLTPDGFGAGGLGGLSFAGFSDEPEFATMPIKFAVPPFSTPVVVTNIILSSFEGVPVGTNRTGEFVDGWRVVTNSTVVVTGGARHGTNVLSLQQARISRAIPTVIGQQYTLTFAYRTDQSGTVNAQVILNGVLQRFITATRDWQVYTLAFTATRTDTILDLLPAFNSGGMLLDDFEITDPRAFIYYIPEEDLSALRGESAEGVWQLEIWDSRTGPGTGPTTLLRWELQLDLTLPDVGCQKLLHGKPITDQVGSDEIKYFCVDVPRTASFATNRLTGSGDLVLLFNQNGLPSGNNPGDVSIDNRGPNAGEFLLLSRTSPVPPALQQGQRYYLGVKNRAGNETNNFTIRVDFDRTDGITTLTNRQLYSTNLVATNVLDYYQYFVSSNVTSLRVQLFPTNGNVNLYVRQEPLPDPATFDFRSVNPGTNNEFIIINTNSAPPLAPGWWYLGVQNVDTSAVNYSIIVTEITNALTSVIDLTNGVPVSGTLGPAARSGPSLLTVPTINLVPPATEQIYKITLAATDPGALFELYDLTGNADLLVGRDAIPDLDFFHKRSVLPEIYPDKVVIRTNATFPTLGGDWYLKVINRTSNSVNFTVKATIAPTNQILILTNKVILTNTVPGNIEGNPPETDYYRFTVSAPSLFADFAVAAINGNVDLFLRKGALPSPAAADYTGSSGGLTNEFIRVRTNSAPVKLSAGDWFLAVVNRELPSNEGSVGYSVQAIESTNAIIDLVSGVPFRRTIGVDNGLDYYRFPVSTNASSAFFELFNRGGDLNFYLRFGLPLPGPGAFDYTDNRLLPDPQIFITTNSTPVRLQSGDWYIAVTNLEQRPITYTIEATEFFGTIEPPGGTSTNEVPILAAYVTNDLFCLVWESKIGTNYFVEGKTNLNAPVWDAISPTITATATNTTYCIPLSDPHRFFRVVEGINPASPPTNTIPSTTSGFFLTISSVTNGYALRWRAASTNRFELQYSTNLAPPWNVLTNPVTSTTTNFFFLDDGSRSGGLGRNKFYRLRLL